ncbi:UDP-N-acetyl-D-glucosamine dehydrogenase [Anaerobacillus alkalilacustris]|uniref:UDP-N-acetyl-D-glucosamine dehydrogenase n=1 Tax=Anaerobacillus alkalilacustris TaxID=393763 RepID=A0A1S2LDD5_9BACI|nr:nucleotide sugar dehydrogenase [Anaerobacillus alkalilacustris]OIJ10401.1 UDP-N-acetyl-D-glucosamine dehydrogenase [Anaerobacillus alkalilacustris]
MQKSEAFYRLKEKFLTMYAKVAVIGLGYVGLPLAIELAKKGYQVFGIDIDQSKVKRLEKCESYVSDVASEDVYTAISAQNFIPTTDYSILKEVDAISICVPTPLTKYQQPNIDYIQAAVTEIKKYMHKELLIILESTTYPGTTEELIEKQLELEGYKVGVDYFLCFSPERVDPGNHQFKTKNIPKVIGGTTPQCSELAMTLYQDAISTMYPVSSPKVAEMTKLLENTFRSVNIAFINEMAMLSEKLHINIWEVIEAASTKPFGFMPFMPGPGIGGHCIPLDPMYLVWKAKESKFYCRHIELAQEINMKMPHFVISKVVNELNHFSKSVKGSKILLLGMAYKPNIDDLRESPSLEIYEILKEKGASVQFYDPHATKFIDKAGNEVCSIEVKYERLQEYDCILLLTNHDVFNYQAIAENANMIIDTRNAFKRVNCSNIVTIGDSSIKI